MTFASGLAIISGIRVLATEILLERMVDAAVLIKKIKLLLILSLMALLAMSASCLAEEKMQFVDAHGATGYYVDTNSIVFSTVEEADNQYEIVSARVAVIKAKQNRRYLYMMQFNPELVTYQILSAKIQQYDNKAILETDANEQPPAPYSLTSPMKAIVDFIYEQPRNN